LQLAKLDRWSCVSRLGEQNGFLSGPGESWIEGAWTICRHTTAMRARACHDASGIETFCNMDVL
jgi:hypothetical protein